MGQITRRRAAVGTGASLALAVTVMPGHSSSAATATPSGPRFQATSASLPALDSLGDRKDKVDQLKRSRARFGLSTEDKTATDMVAGRVPLDLSLGTPLAPGEVAGVKRQMDIQAKLDHSLGRMAELVGPAFAGVSIDQKRGGRIKVSVAAEVDLTKLRAELPADTVIEVERVPYSQTVLKGMQDRVTAYVREQKFVLGGQTIAAISQDHKRGAVVVMVAGSDVQKTEAGVQAALASPQLEGIQIYLQYGAEPFKAEKARWDFPPVQAGSKLLSCTVGMKARRNSNGHVGIVTAGHCATGLAVGAPEFMSSANGFAGPIMGHWETWMPTEGCFCIGNSDSGFVQTSNAVTTLYGGDDAKNDINDAGYYYTDGVAPGGVINLSAGETNWNEQSTVPGDPWVHLLANMEENYQIDDAQGIHFCTHSGDSGSPVYKMDQGEWAGAGIHFGAMFGHCTETEVAVMSRLKYVTADLGVTLI